MTVTRSGVETHYDAPSSPAVRRDLDIDALLLEAENRMKENATALATAKASSSSIASLLKFPRLNPGSALPKPYIKSNLNGPVKLANSLLVPRATTAEDEKTARQYRRVEDPLKIKKAIIENKDKTAGAKWFNMPKTEMTPQIKREIQMIKLRNVLDPHKHFKKDDSRELPKYFQMGTIVEGSTEFHSARINRKDRKKSFVDEIMSSKDNRARFTKKYNEIQVAKRSGKKGFYNKMKAKRRGKY